MTTYAVIFTVVYIIAIACMMYAHNARMSKRGTQEYLTYDTVYEGDTIVLLERPMTPDEIAEIKSL